MNIIYTIFGSVTPTVESLSNHTSPPPNTHIVTECILIFARGTSKGAMKVQRSQNSQISPISPPPLIRNHRVM